MQKLTHCSYLHYLLSVSIFWMLVADQGGEDEYLDPSLRLEHYCFENQFGPVVLTIM